LLQHTEQVRFLLQFAHKWANRFNCAGSFLLFREKIRILDLLMRWFIRLRFFDKSIGYDRHIRGSVYLRRFFRCAHRLNNSPIFQQVTQSRRFRLLIFAQRAELFVMTAIHFYKDLFDCG